MYVSWLVFRLRRSFALRTFLFSVLPFVHFTVSNSFVIYIYFFGFSFSLLCVFCYIATIEFYCPCSFFSFFDSSIMFVNGCVCICLMLEPGFIIFSPQFRFPQYFPRFAFCFLPFDLTVDFILPVFESKICHFV